MKKVFHLLILISSLWSFSESFGQYRTHFTVVRAPFLHPNENTQGFHNFFYYAKGVTDTFDGYTPPQNATVYKTRAIPFDTLTINHSSDLRKANWYYVKMAGLIPCGRTGCLYHAVYSGFTLTNQSKGCVTETISKTNNIGVIKGVSTLKITTAAPTLTQPVRADGLDLDNICSESITMSTSNVADEGYLWQVSENYNGPWTTFKHNLESTPSGHIVTISQSDIATAIGNKSDYFVRVNSDQECFFDRASLPAKVSFRKAAPASVNFTPISPSCPNSGDGAIEITGFRDVNNNTYSVSGILNYTLSNGLQTRNFSSSQQPSASNPIRLTSGNGLSLTKGNWNVSIETQDPNGVCEKSFPISIQDPPQHFIASSSITNQVKCDGSTGSIQVSAQGGHAPYRYFLTNGAGTPLLNSGATTSTSHTFTNVPEGIYRTNITSCGTSVTSAANYTLDNPNPTFVIANSSFTNASCKNINNGTINITVAGGSGSYHYAIGAAGAFQTMGSNVLALTNLASGNYLIRLRDANDCEVQRNFTINAPTPPTITSITPSTPIPCPGSLGTIQVTCASGAGPFSYYLKENGTTVREVLNTTNRTIQFDPIKQGVYTVDVRDCSDLVSGAITLEDPKTPISFSSVTPTNVSCIGNADGQITVNIAGGSGNYEISSGGGFTTFIGATYTLRNLAATDHAITIRDASLGCVANTTATVGSPAPLSVNTPQVSQPIICLNASSGSINVSITNGAAPFTYKITGKNGFSQTSNALGDRNYTFTNLPADAYTVNVEGCNESVTANEITLTAPINTTQLSLKPANISCSGSSEGQIETTISGGTPPYQIRLGTTTYSGVTEQPHIFSGIGPNDYQVSVLDNNNCLTQANINIPTPKNVTINNVLVSEPVKCLNGTGSIQATASGGASSYTFNLSGSATASVTVSQPSHVFTDLQSGSYQVSVSSCGLSDLSGTVLLAEPTNTIAFDAAVATNATCVAQPNGVISIAASGGLPPYAAALTGQTPVSLVGNTYQFTGLEATTHAITLSDANNCSVETSMAVGTSPAISASFVPQHVSCFNFNNGLVTINPTGGDSKTVFEYSLNGGTFQSLNTFLDLPATKHAVVVRDANATNCSWTGTFDITQPTPIVLDQFEVTQGVSCFGENDASIAVASSGGPSLHHYSLLKGTDTIASVSSVSSHVFAALAAGDYRLLLSSDATGCGLEQTISITQPDPLKVSVSLSDFNGSAVSCSNALDGQVSFVSSGGTYPHTFSTDGLDDKISASELDIVSFTGFGKGDVKFIMEDLNGCAFDTVVSFTAPDSLIASYKKSVYPNGLNISCNQATDGSIHSYAQGGTAPYSIGIQLGSTVPTSDSAVFSSLSAGTYFITTTDLNGCSVRDSALLLEPEVLVIPSIELQEITGFNLACNGDVNGKATITATGGVLPYRVSLDGGADLVVNETVFSLTQLGEGLHSISLTDVAGCVVGDDFTLTAPPVLTLDPSFTQITKPDCGNDPTGAIEVKAVGGVSLASGNYTYSLTYKNPPSNLPFPAVQSKMANSVAFSQLIGGSYSMVVTDSNGCSFQQALNVNTNQQLTVATSGDILTCKGDTNGTGQVIVQGGSEPYHITMYSNDVFIDEFLDLAANVSLEINSLSEGKYTLQITDANGCGYLSDDYFFEVLAPEKSLQLTHSFTNTLCAGADNGTATLFATGGWDAATPYAFGLAISNLVADDSVFTDLAPGNYTYFVQDSAGCIDSTSVVITEPLPLVSDIQNIVNPRCFGETSGLFEFTTTGGTAPYQFSLDSTSWRTSTTFDSLSKGAYTLITRDSLSCITKNEVVLTQPDSLMAVLANQTSTACLLQTASATAAVSGGNPPYAFKWQDDNQLVVSSSLSAQGLGAKRYLFSVADQLGCVDSLPVIISFANVILAQVNIVQQVSCFNQADGNATLLVSDIVTPYKVDWDNGIDTDTTFGLAAGSHQVIITDADGCTKQLDFTISQPDSLIIDLQSTNPICNGACAGSIVSTVSGGTGTYSFAWDNGRVSSSLSELCAGDYLLAVTDKNGCLAEQNASIVDPPALSLPVADSLFLVCEGNNAFINLDQYSQHQWSFPNGNILTTNSINTNLIGDYSVSVVNDDNCIITANFELAPSSDVFNAEFILPKETYVGDTIVCVNLTKPNPENVSWQFDTATTTQIRSDNIYQLLVFKTEGQHQLAINAQIGECSSSQTKVVTVYSSDERVVELGELGYIEKGIRYLNIFPNPNDGAFQCEVELHQQTDIKILVVDQLGNTLFSQTQAQVNDEVFPVSINNPQSGSYILIIQTKDDVKNQQFIVK